jgi:hypothetical protein
MGTTDELVEKILKASQIPSARRRKDVSRELRAHIEDFILVAAQAGYDDAEIDRLVRTNFGDPQEIANEFSRVYTRERTIFRLSVFLLSTLVAAAFACTGVFLIQAAMAAGLGISSPPLRSHQTIEAFYLITTAAAYVGFISLERMFDRARMEKAIASLAGLFAIAGVASMLTIGHGGILFLAFVSGVLVRIVQACCKRPLLQAATVVACFGVFGVIAVCQQPSALISGVTFKLLGWVAIGVCCHLMTGLASRVDRAMFDGMQKI